LSDTQLYFRLCSESLILRNNWLPLAVTLAVTFLGAVLGPPLFGALFGGYRAGYAALAIPTLACCVLQIRNRDSMS